LPWFWSSNSQLKIALTIETIKRSFAAQTTKDRKKKQHLLAVLVTLVGELENGT